MPWAPSSVTDEDWGTLRVTAGPKGDTPTDVTFFRDVPCEIRSFSFTDPWGPEAATIAFPQITGFDEPGVTTGLEWMVDGAIITIWRVHADGVTQTVLWDGQIVAWDDNENEQAGETLITCRGSLLQLVDYRRAPGITRQAASLDDIWRNEFDHSPGVREHLKTESPVVLGGPTGISFAGRPAWPSAYEYVSDLHARSVISTTDSWVTQWQPPRTPILTKRSAYGQTVTLTFGTPGLSTRLTRDYVSADNVVYIEGVDTYGGGGRYRNLYENGPDDAVFFQPGGYLDDVHGYDENGTASLDDNSGRIDSALQRRERYMNLGEGFALVEAKSLAQFYVDRDSDPGWFGSLVLRIDPEERSRLELRAGDRVLLKHWAGSGATGVTFQITRCEHAAAGGIYQTSLTVDSRNRDDFVVQKLIERIRAGTSPSRRLQLGRDSVQTIDSKVPWSDSAGSGWLPLERFYDGTSTVSATGGTWAGNIFSILASEGPDLIVRLDVVASLDTTFAVVVCDWEVTAAILDAATTDPLTFDGAWYQAIPGCLFAAGQLLARCGYHPSTEELGGVVTGVHRDEDTWTITHNRGTPSAGGGDVDNSGNPAKVWVAIFPESTADFYARLIHGNE